MVPCTIVTPTYYAVYIVSNDRIDQGIEATMGIVIVLTITEILCYVQTCTCWWLSILKRLILNISLLCVSLLFILSNSSLKGNKVSSIVRYESEQLIIDCHWMNYKEEAMTASVHAWCTYCHGIWPSTKPMCVYFGRNPMLTFELPCQSNLMTPQLIIVRSDNFRSDVDCVFEWHWVVLYTRVLQLWRPQYCPLCVNKRKRQ